MVQRLTCIRMYTYALCISFHLIDGNFTQYIFQLTSFFYVLTNSVFFSVSVTVNLNNTAFVHTFVRSDSSSSRGSSSSIKYDANGGNHIKSRQQH